MATGRQLVCCGVYEAGGVTRAGAAARPAARATRLGRADTGVRITPLCRAWDEQGRLLGIVWADGWGIEFTYDAQGRRLTKTTFNHQDEGRQTTTFHYLAGTSQVLWEEGPDGQRLDYTYDPTGRRLTITHEGETYWYVYNGHGDVAGLVDPTRTMVARYEYDDYGRVVHMWGADGQEVREGQGQVHYLNGDITVGTVSPEEQGNSGSMSGGASSGAALGQGGTPRGQGEGLEKKNAPVEAVELTGDGGMPLDGPSDSAVAGDATGASGGSEIVKLNPYRYAGYRYDRETELYFLQSRYYDSWSNRFVSRDSHRGEQRQPLSLNRYAYAVNSSVNYIDHSGEAPTSFAWTGETPAPPFPLYFDYLQLEPKTRVKLVQRLLDRMGYEVVVDGIHGDQTDRALENFAKDYGLPVVIAENFVAYSDEKTKEYYGHRTYRRAVVTREMYRSLTCAYTDRYYRRIGFVTNPDRVSIPERVSFPRSETVGAMKVTVGYVWPTIDVPIVITDPFHLRDKGYCCTHSGEKGHQGIDIGPGWYLRGSPIYATKGGHVDTINLIYNTRGISVTIDHGTGDPPPERSSYRHLDCAFLERPQQKVMQGQIIGVLGSTGWSFGPHLHFELRLKDEPVNPLLHLELPEGSIPEYYVASSNPDATCPPTN